LLSKKIGFLAFVIQLLAYSIISYRVLNFKKENTTDLKPAKVLSLLNLSMLIFATSVFLLYITHIVFNIKSIDLTSIIIVFLIVFVTILEVHMIKRLKTNFIFTELEKYKNSNLQTQNINDLGKQLNQLLVSEKVFLDSNLKATDLANLLKISRHQLTELINQELGYNFSELINKYRVDYIKKDLLSKKKSHLSISGLAKEAGFKSDATFYRVFKEQTGVTPSEFINQNP
jgi:AraC-like DNA-binding protein